MTDSKSSRPAATSAPPAPLRPAAPTRADTPSATPAPPSSPTAASTSTSRGRNVKLLRAECQSSALPPRRVLRPDFLPQYGFRARIPSVVSLKLVDKLSYCLRFCTG